MSPDDEGLVKVTIPLRGDALESGFRTETVWAEPLGDDRYMIWNVPLFAYNIEMRDVVRCRPNPDGDHPVVSAVETRGDCFGMRVYFDLSATDADIEQIVALFKARRAVVGQFDRTLWSFGLRWLDDYEAMGPVLEPWVDDGVLEFESILQDDQPAYDGEEA